MKSHHVEVSTPAYMRSTFNSRVRLLEDQSVLGPSSLAPQSTPSSHQRRQIGNRAVELIAQPDPHKASLLDLVQEATLKAERVIDMLQEVL